MTLEETQEQLLQLQEQLNKLTEDNKTLNDIVESKTKRERELEEHNQKLFLRVTNKVENEPIKDEEVPFCFDKSTYELLSDREKQELKELIEEE